MAPSRKVCKYKIVNEIVSIFYLLFFCQRVQEFKFPTLLTCRKILPYELRSCRLSDKLTNVLICADNFPS